MSKSMSHEEFDAKHAAYLNSVKKNYVRFLRSGFSFKRFTKVLYNAFYIDSNLFIAHYDRSGFYDTRFNTAKGLVETVHVLLNGAPRNETHKLLRELTKDHLQYFENLRQTLLADELNSYEKLAQQAIESSRRTFFKP